MTVNADLKIPFEIAQYIVSEFEKNGLRPTPVYLEGPNHYYNQLEEGLILRVQDITMCPIELYTRYGTWIIMHPLSGYYAHIFAIVKEKLNLVEGVALPGQPIRPWIIRTWNGITFPPPKFAQNNYSLSYDDYKSFLSLISP